MQQLIRYSFSVALSESVGFSGITVDIDSGYRHQISLSAFLFDVFAVMYRTCAVLFMPGSLKITPFLSLFGASFISLAVLSL